MQNNIKILRYNTSCLCFYDKTSLKYLFVGIRYLFEHLHFQKDIEYLQIGIRYLFESVDVQSEMQL